MIVEIEVAKDDSNNASCLDLAQTEWIIADQERLDEVITPKYLKLLTNSRRGWST